MSQYPGKNQENLHAYRPRLLHFYLEYWLVLISQTIKNRRSMKSLTNLTDQQLIHLFMENDAEALETLILRHKDKIYTSIFLLVKDKYLAEDIFQDVFIRVIDTVRSGRYTEEVK